MKRHKSVETKYYEERDSVYQGLQTLDRRTFMKVSAAAAGAATAAGVLAPGSFANVRIASAQDKTAFNFAYLSDSHLYVEAKNDRFARALMRAVEDINRLSPQPDFVLYGGDLAQLGRPEELAAGMQILKDLKAPLKMMVGEHDWYYDMGEKWRDLFGQPTYSFDHKGAHFVVLNSVIEKDFWTERNMSPAERMGTVAGLDNGAQNPFTVGVEQIAWLAKDLEKIDKKTPIVVFSHSPLYKIYKKWNFWTDDAEAVQGVLKKFKNVTVIHGHTHQMLTNRIGNMNFHGMLSTAWPWPYAPEGMPELTIPMTRPDPFNPHDGCGDGLVQVHPDGLVDKIYNLWNRNPVTVKKTYLSSKGKKDKPAVPGRPAY